MVAFFAFQCGFRALATAVSDVARYLLRIVESDIDATHLEQDGDALVARIHDVLFDFTFDAPVATTSLCVKPRVLVSAHARPWRSIDKVREEVESGPSFSLADSNSGALIERSGQCVG